MRNEKVLTKWVQKRADISRRHNEERGFGESVTYKKYSSQEQQKKAASDLPNKLEWLAEQILQINAKEELKL